MVTSDSFNHYRYCHHLHQTFLFDTVSSDTSLGITVSSDDSIEFIGNNLTKMSASLPLFFDKRREVAVILASLIELVWVFHPLFSETSFNFIDTSIIIQGSFCISTHGCVDT